MAFDVCLAAHFDMNVFLKEGENVVAEDQPTVICFIIQ